MTTTQKRENREIHLEVHTSSTSSKAPAFDAQ